MPLLALALWHVVRFSCACAGRSSRPGSRKLVCSGAGGSHRFCDAPAAAADSHLVGFDPLETAGQGPTSECDAALPGHALGHCRSNQFGGSPGLFAVTKSPAFTPADRALLLLQLCRQQGADLTRLASSCSTETPGITCADVDDHQRRLFTCPVLLGLRPRLTGRGRAMAQS